MVQGHLWKNTFFGRFSTHFCSQNGLFSRHIGIFHGPKPVQMGSKWAKNTCLSIPKGPGSLLEKHIFDPFLTHFLSQNGPFSRHFGIFHGPKRVTTGSKRAKNTCLCIPNGPGSLLEKHVFDPFLTHFLSQNGPFSRHFGIFHGPKRVTTGSEWAKNTCLSIQNGLGSLLEKSVFFDPFWSRGDFCLFLAVSVTAYACCLVLLKHHFISHENSDTPLNPPSCEQSVCFHERMALA